MAEARLPLPDRWKGSLDPDLLEEEIEEEGTYLLLSLAILGLFIDQRDQTSQVLEATRIMIAAEIFAAGNGRAPDSLDELVPHILPTLPKDPMTERPFGYTLLDDDPDGRPFLLYYVGADGVDDGGHYEPNMPGWGWKPHMVGFDVPFNPSRPVHE